MRSGDSLTSSMLSDTDYAEAVSDFGLAASLASYNSSPLLAVGICRIFWHTDVLCAYTFPSLLHSIFCAAP